MSREGGEEGEEGWEVGQPLGDGSGGWAFSCGAAPHHFLPPFAAFVPFARLPVPHRAVANPSPLVLKMSREGAEAAQGKSAPAGFAWRSSPWRTPLSGPRPCRPLFPNLIPHGICDSQIASLNGP